MATAEMKANCVLGCLEATDCSPLVVLVRMPLEYCVQFGTLWEKYWQTGEQLWWLGSWTV